MKLLYAPQSPCSRKARAAAIELGLHDQIYLVYVEVVPGRPNRDFGDNFNPLRKIPALVLDDGRVIMIHRYLRIPRHAGGRRQIIPPPR